MSGPGGNGFLQSDRLQKLFQREHLCRGIRGGAEPAAQLQKRNDRSLPRQIQRRKEQFHCLGRDRRQRGTCRVFVEGRIPAASAQIPDKGIVFQPVRLIARQRRAAGPQVFTDGLRLHAAGSGLQRVHHSADYAVAQELAVSGEIGRHRVTIQEIFQQGLIAPGVGIGNADVAPARTAAHKLLHPANRQFARLGCVGGRGKSQALRHPLPGCAARGEKIFRQMGQGARTRFRHLRRVMIGHTAASGQFPQGAGC